MRGESGNCRLCVCMCSSGITESITRSDASEVLPKIVVCLLRVCYCYSKADYRLALNVSRTGATSLTLLFSEVTATPNFAVPCLGDILTCLTIGEFLAAATSLSLSSRICYAVEFAPYKDPTGRTFAPASYCGKIVCTAVLPLDVRAYT